MVNLQLKSQSELFSVYFDSNSQDDIETNFSGFIPNFFVNGGWGVFMAKNNKKIKIDIQDIKNKTLNTDFDNTYLVILNGNLSLNGRTFNQWHILKKQQAGQIVFDDASDNLSIASVLEY